MLSRSTIAPPRRGAVDWRWPINWRHPLNRGRVAWWLPLPNNSHGSTVRDLCRKTSGLDATTTGVTASSGWSSLGPPGAVGPALVLDGSTGQALGGNGSWPTKAFTLCCWLYGTSFPKGANTFFAIEDSTISTSYCVGWVGSDGTVNFRLQSAGSPSNFLAITSNGVLLSANTWYRVAITWTGGTADTTTAMYFNAVKNASPSQSISGSFTAPTSSALAPIIGNQRGQSQQFTGRATDFSVWDRCLSTSDLAWEYDLARRGYPGVLNRFSPVFAVGPPVVAGSALFRPATLSLGSGGPHYQTPVNG